MKDTDIEKIKKELQDSLIFKERVIKSLTWLIEDAKYRYDDCKNNVDNGLGGGYSEELEEAIAVLKKLKGET